MLKGVLILVAVQLVACQDVARPLTTYRSPPPSLQLLDGTKTDEGAAGPFQPRPVQPARPVQPIEPEGGHPAPEPYSFSYSSPTEDGSLTTREESQDKAGRVVGFYIIDQADGTRRRVDYVADQDGFRATVQSNEHGSSTGTGGADAPVIRGSVDGGSVITNRGVGYVPYGVGSSVRPLAPEGVRVGAVGIGQPGINVVGIRGADGVGFRGSFGGRSGAVEVVDVGGVRTRVVAPAGAIGAVGTGGRSVLVTSDGIPQDQVGVTYAADGIGNGGLSTFTTTREVGGDVYGIRGLGARPVIQAARGGIGGLGIYQSGLRSGLQGQLLEFDVPAINTAGVVGETLLTNQAAGGYGGYVVVPGDVGHTRYITSGRAVGVPQYIRSGVATGTSGNVVLLGPDQIQRIHDSRQIVTK